MIGFYCLVVALLSVSAVECVLYTNCSAIPKAKFPNITILMKICPLTFTYSMNGMFECAQEVFTNPSFGNTSYTGNALITSNKTVTVFQFTATDDGMILSAIVCGTNNVATTYSPIRFEVLADGSANYCAAACNGTEFLEMVCASNNPSAFEKSTSELVASCQGVSNGNQIKARNTAVCDTIKKGGCSMFA